MKKPIALSKWADKRLGFKHELILTLLEDGFTYREAEDIIEVMLASLKASLLRREDVTVENFGSWHVREASRSRGYRFGKVVRFKKYKLQFRMEDDALLFAFDPAWKPHASWADTEKRSPKLSRKQRAELARKHEAQRIQTLYLKYVRAIVRFFIGSLIGEDWDMFWAWRWNTSWYVSEADFHRPLKKELRSIDDVENVIAQTKPAALDQQWSNRVIDLLQWYARWSVRLDVERNLWDQAERDARERLKSGHRWGSLFAGTADS